MAQKKKKKSSGGRRVRADDRLIELGLAAGRAETMPLFMAGLVHRPDGARIEKPSDKVSVDATLLVKGKSHPYVSRGGVKLACALKSFSVSVKGLVCADIGISSGGFTDCLLQNGAAQVHGVDVSYGQTDWKIRTDPRVTLHERTNAKQLVAGFFGVPIALMVIDASFIGLRQLLPGLTPHIAPHGQLIALIKPQFELEKDQVPDGGIVTDEAARARAIELAKQAAEASGLQVLGVVPSPIKGGQGNVEFLLHAKKTKHPVEPDPAAATQTAST